MLHAADDSREVTIPGQYDEGGVGLASFVFFGRFAGIVLVWYWCFVGWFCARANNLFFDRRDGRCAPISVMREAEDVVKTDLGGVSVGEKKVAKGLYYYAKNEQDVTHWGHHLEGVVS